MAHKRRCLRLCESLILSNLPFLLCQIRPWMVCFPAVSHNLFFFTLWLLDLLSWHPLLCFAWPAECTAADAFKHAGENIVFASGSPFENVDLGIFPCILNISFRFPLPGVLKTSLTYSYRVYSKPNKDRTIREIQFQACSMWGIPTHQASATLLNKFLIQKA